MRRSSGGPNLLITDRYWVPASLSWRMPCVGSWSSQNTLQQLLVGNGDGLHRRPDGLGVARATEQTSSYVGFGV